MYFRAQKKDIPQKQNVPLNNVQLPLKYEVICEMPFDTFFLGITDKTLELFLG